MIIVDHKVGSSTLRIPGEQWKFRQSLRAHNRRVLLEWIPNV